MGFFLVKNKTKQSFLLVIIAKLIHDHTKIFKHLKQKL